MLWKEQNLSLEDVKVGQTINIQFEGDPSDGIKIKSIKPSCGCTKTSFDKTDSILTVKYKAKPIPYHLIKQGWYKAEKRIMIIDMKGGITTLSFKIKIVK